MTTVRCKLTVEKILEETNPHPVNPTDIEKHGEFIKFRAKYTGSPEDNTFSKYTPTAEFTMNVTNPEVFGFFKDGKAYYFDITEA